MEGVSDYEGYGIFTDGGALTLKHLREDGSVSSPRVYLLNEDEDKYEMIKLTGNEFTFDVDVSKLPCGMNGALYLSEREETGARSELNTGGASYGTGYCDAQCFTTPFINGVVSGEEPRTQEEREERKKRKNSNAENHRATSTPRAPAATNSTSGKPTPAPPTSPPTPAT
jgi:hypothetical protein